MDQTTINDIRQRVTRWQKDAKTNGKESERTWIFAVNIDDVELLLKEIERLELENADLRLVIKGMRDMRLSLMEGETDD